MVKKGGFMIGIARAHTNIALIKYWGKRDEQQFLPMNSSLSLTLDAFYTDTRVVFDDTLTTDVFYLNGQQTDVAPITRFLNLFRADHQQLGFARVDSYNFVPTAAGLASSASAFAALAGAVNQASGLQLDTTTLSTYARRGSGSATRSLFGGFVEWEKGTQSHNSVATFIDDASWDIGMIVIAVNKAQKAVSSRAGMAQTVETSPFYDAWVTSATNDLIAIKQAIFQKDFQTLGEIAEWNGMKMHASALAANPPLWYFQPESLIAMQQARLLREKGFAVYFTMDAGPNVKLLCRYSDIPALLTELQTVFSADMLIPTRVGRGMHTLTHEQFEQSVEKFYTETMLSKKVHANG